MVAYTNAAVNKQTVSNAGVEPASDLLNPGFPEDQPNYEIVYPDGEEANVAIEPGLYPESFAWP